MINFNNMITAIESLGDKTPRTYLGSNPYSATPPLQYGIQNTSKTTQPRTFAQNYWNTDSTNLFGRSLVNPTPKPAQSVQPAPTKWTMPSYNQQGNSYSDQPKALGSNLAQNNISLDNEYDTYA